MSIYASKTVVCVGCEFSAIKSEELLLRRDAKGGGWTREVVPTLMGTMREDWRCPACTAKHEREKARLAEVKS